MMFFVKPSRHCNSVLLLPLAKENTNTICMTTRSTFQKIPLDVEFIEIEKRPLAGLAEIMMGYKNA